MHNFVVHSNESAYNKSGQIGLEQVRYIAEISEDVALNKQNTHSEKYYGCDLMGIAYFP